ncbi:MAG: hypothetical protein B7Z37_03000 [Verrucomicrobia bacterium 12-59-8]|nr:MAG: hypothetical protein B7Z37_03000 [Verrucomicrobia bacterium 12-59-8]
MTNINVASFRPIDSQVLLEPDFARDEKRRSGLVVPDHVKDKVGTPFGTVVAVGPGRQLESGQLSTMWVKPGDRVQVHAWKGNPVEVNGRALLCCDQNFIIGIIEDLPAVARTN